jgi:hypothetical protein
MANRFTMLSALCSIALVAAATSSNAATVTIGLQEAGFPSFQTAGSTGSATVTSANFPGGVFGTFAIDSITGSSNPFAFPIVVSGSSSLGTGTGGTLNVFVTVQGLTNPTGAFFSGFTENAISGNTSVQLLTFVDPNNGLFTGTPIGSATFTGLSSSSSGFNIDPALLTNPGGYSLTEEFIITTTGQGSALATITVAVPEASTWAMIMLGFLGVGLVACRRRADTNFRMA